MDRTNVNANNEEYSPSDNSTNHNACLVTKQGTLIDFLDAYQEKNELCIYHHNLDAVELQAQLYWEKIFVLEL
eukprot:5746872-Ditylum_brightwellii.AAC.1